MRKNLIIALILVFVAQVSFAATAVNKTTGKTQPQTVKPVASSSQTVKKQPVKEDKSYLLKYNIDDLDAAPWLNNGKRKI